MAVVLLLCFRVTSASDVPTQMSESSNQQPEPGNLISRPSADGAIGRCRLPEKRSCFPEPRLGSGLALFPEISAKDSFRKAFFGRLQPPPLVMRASAQHRCRCARPANQNNLHQFRDARWPPWHIVRFGQGHGPPRIHSVWCSLIYFKTASAAQSPWTPKRASWQASCFVKAKHCFMVSEGPGTGSEAFSSPPFPFDASYFLPRQATERNNESCIHGNGPCCNDGADNML